MPERRTPHPPAPSIWSVRAGSKSCNNNYYLKIIPTVRGEKAAASQQRGRTKKSATRWDSLASDQAEPADGARGNQNPQWIDPRSEHEACRRTSNRRGFPPSIRSARQHVATSDHDPHCHWDKTAAYNLLPRRITEAMTQTEGDEGHSA